MRLHRQFRGNGEYSLRLSWLELAYCTNISPRVGPEDLQTGIPVTTFNQVSNKQNVEARSPIQRKVRTE